MSGIAHHSVQHGNVQDLTTTIGGGKDAQDTAVFVVSAGAYHLGKMQRAANLKVVAGQMLINGKPHDHKNGLCSLKTGEEVHISTADGVIYLCYYK